MIIQKFVDSIAEKIAEETRPFVESRIGEIFLSLVLVGPITFLPTIYIAWTAPNIDSLRTLTWPLMIVVNMSATLGLVHNGDWRMRLVMFIWIIVFAIVFVATIVR